VQGSPIQHIRVFALVDFSLLDQQAIERGQAATQATQNSMIEILIGEQRNH
jgi:hypothetical protein